MTDADKIATFYDERAAREGIRDVTQTLEYAVTLSQIEECMEICMKQEKTGEDRLLILDLGGGTGTHGKRICSGPVH